MIIKLAVVSVVTVLAALGFEKHKSVSVSMIIGLSILLGFYIISAVSGVLEQANEWFSYIGANAAYFKLLLKCLGISICGQIAADICEDAGYRAPAHQVILVTKLAMILCCMPLFKNILEICIGLINK